MLPPPPPQICLQKEAGPKEFWQQMTILAFQCQPQTILTKREGFSRKCQFVDPDPPGPGRLLRHAALILSRARGGVSLLIERFGWRALKAILLLRLAVSRRCLKHVMRAESIYCFLTRMSYAGIWPKARKPKFHIACCKSSAKGEVKY